MPNEEKITVNGVSGAKYDFGVYPWGTPFKAVGGVYLVLKKLPAGNYSMLYVGQTGDLSERFDHHHKEPCFTRNGKTHIAARVEGDVQRRLAVETDLIRNYRTTCND